MIIIESLKKTIGYFISNLLDVISLINPASVGPVTKNMKTRPLWFSRLYLLTISLAIFLGYFVYFSAFKEGPLSLENSLKVSLRNYFIAALLPMAMAYLLYLFDLRLVKVKVTHADALTLISYACSLGILGGIFRMLTTRQFIDTWILHLIFLMYSIYLLYALLAARFGFGIAIKPFK